MVQWKVSFRYLTYCFDPNRWKLSLIDGVDVSHFILFGEKSRSFHQKKKRTKRLAVIVLVPIFLKPLKKLEITAPF